MPSSRVSVSRSTNLVGIVERQRAASDHQRGADQSHPGAVDGEARNAPDRQRDQACREDYSGSETAGILLEQAAGNHEREQTRGHRQHYDAHYRDATEPEDPLRSNPRRGLQGCFGWQACRNGFVLHTPVNGWSARGSPSISKPLSKLNQASLR